MYLWRKERGEHHAGRNHREAPVVVEIVAAMMTAGVLWQQKG